MVCVFAICVREGWGKGGGAGVWCLVPYSVNFGVFRSVFACAHGHASARILVGRSRAFNDVERERERRQTTGRTSCVVAVPKEEATECNLVLYTCAQRDTFCADARSATSMCIGL